ncbi:uncharacterized protein LOC123564302 isoform X1 [Mercenaria mercenaria]|uniref:uncharacterized protein LOC123564302 isoform X1 n=1 Tax=Mercenaria mercenaria TaxID=6596 RepID=UPI001E1D8D89|nr:uncharacterized protein LOC123564302 isoform X1 [Mercenaria mercenaria]
MPVLKSLKFMSAANLSLIVIIASVINGQKLVVIHSKNCSIAKEGCGRVPATPAPTTTPSPTEPTINGSLRGIQCTKDEANRTGCRNGGTCFVLVIQGERIASCHCTEEYEGKICQDLNIAVIIPSQDPDQVAKAGIAASIAVLIVIVIVFVAVAIVYYRRRRQERMDKKPQSGVNGSLLPENHIQPPNPNMHTYARNGHNNCNSLEEKKPLQIQYQITSV